MRSRHGFVCGDEVLTERRREGDAGFPVRIPALRRRGDVHVEWDRDNPVERRFHKVMDRIMTNQAGISDHIEYHLLRLWLGEFGVEGIVMLWLVGIFLVVNIARWVFVGFSVSGGL